MNLPHFSELDNIGMISRLHGKEGGVVLNLYNDFSELIRKTEYLFVDIDGQVVPFFLLHEKTSPKGSNRLVVHFEEATDEHQSMELLNCQVYALKQFTKATASIEGINDEIDLLGYEVYDIHSGYLGFVSDIQEDKMQYTLVVSQGGKVQLIPFVGAFIVSLNEKGQTLKMDLPEGLIDLND